MALEPLWLTAKDRTFLEVWLILNAGLCALLRCSASLKRKEKEQVYRLFLVYTNDYL